MFTGIIEMLGRVARAHSSSIEIRSDLDGLSVGDSISVNGVCLTVRSLGARSFTADISEETRSRTKLGDLSPDDPVNLERPLQVGGRFGGHIVQGHIDGVGRVVGVERLEGSVEMTIEVPGSLSRYVLEKGSVAVDGVSLTVTMVAGDKFSVALIPHTLEVTNLGTLRAGDPVNIEVDILAKYVEGLLGDATPRYPPSL